MLFLHKCIYRHKFSIEKGLKFYSIEHLNALDVVVIYYEHTICSILKKRSLNLNGLFDELILILLHISQQPGEAN